MKLKSVLNKGVAVKYHIVVETPERYKLYDVDYLAKETGITLNTDDVMVCDCFAHIPKEVLDREVTFIGTNKRDGGLEISCLLKNGRILGREKKV